MNLSHSRKGIMSKGNGEFEIWYNSYVGKNMSTCFMSPRVSTMIPAQGTPNGRILMKQLGLKTAHFVMVVMCDQPLVLTSNGCPSLQD